MSEDRPRKELQTGRGRAIEGERENQNGLGFASPYGASHSVALNCNILHCIALQFQLHCIALHLIALHIKAQCVCMCCMYVYVLRVCCVLPFESCTSHHGHGVGAQAGSCNDEKYPTVDTLNNSTKTYIYIHIYICICLEQTARIASGKIAFLSRAQTPDRAIAPQKKKKSPSPSGASRHLMPFPPRAHPLG